MKKFLFAITTGFISVLAATNGAYAQNSVNTEVLEPQANVIAAEKAVTPAKNNAPKIAGVSSKAVKNFTRAYKNVTGENWEKTNNGFTAKFTLNGIMNTIYYTGKGYWAGSLKGYGENKMSADIRKIVKREYYDFTITYVQEAETLESNGKPTYIVHLEDKNSIIQLRIFDGEMEIWKEYQKQS